MNSIPRTTSREPRTTSHAPRTTSREPRTTSHEPRATRYAKPLKWFCVAFVLAALAAAVKRAEEGQLFSAEAIWKAILFCAVGALVQAIGAFVSALRR